jgi:hypothetical protein
VRSDISFGAQLLTVIKSSKCKAPTRSEKDRVWRNEGFKINNKKKHK